MLHVCVAHSNDPDTSFAIDELFEQCDERISDWAPRAGILLAAIDFEHQQLLDAICQRWPGIELVGCTTDGEVSSVLSFQQDSVTLMLFGGDDISFAAGIGQAVSSDAFNIGATAASMAKQKCNQPAKLCFAFPEALTANGVDILEGIKHELGPNIPVAGGLAADQWRFEATYQFFGNQVLRDAVPVLILGGNVMTSHGVASGWRPVGTPGIVTRSQGPIVYEIDNRTALDYYQSYLGDHEPSSQYPLAVYVSDENYYLRAPSGEMDERTGAVSFFANVPQGAKVQMAEATREGILAATQQSMQKALDSYPGTNPQAAFYISCASRRQMLGTRTTQEFEGALSCLKEPLPTCGFYANGEIGPYSGETDTHFHNETFITLILGSD